jgi:hypothetical protein
LQSLPTNLAWWRDVLHRGYVYESEHGLEDEFAQWHDWMATDLLFKSYNKFAKAKGERHPNNRVEFGGFMHEMGGKPFRPRKGTAGEHLSPTFGRTPELIEKDRPHGYRFGPIEGAREVFEKVTKITIDFDTNFEDEE